jgi:hypothetical protein
MLILVRKPDERTSIIPSTVITCNMLDTTIPVGHLGTTKHRFGPGIEGCEYTSGCSYLNNFPIRREHCGDSFHSTDMFSFATTSRSFCFSPFRLLCLGVHELCSAACSFSQVHEDRLLRLQCSQQHFAIHSSPQIPSNTPIALHLTYFEDETKLAGQVRQTGQSSAVPHWTYPILCNSSLWTTSRGNVNFATSFRINCH